MKVALPLPARPEEKARSPARPARPIRVGALLARHADLMWLLAAVALGYLVRLRYIAVADFPLNDGGMFYVMTRELQRSHYLLPAFTSYNGAHIPFAYPPLGLYLAGLLSDVLHVSLLSVFRFLPLLVNLATIVAVCRLARTLLPSRIAAAIAGIAFAVLPNSFVWMIMGGGLTRSLGLFFAVLAIDRFYLLYRRRRNREIILAAVLSALTLLSHLETAYFLGVGVAVLFASYGRSRHALRDTVLVALVAATLAAPWWAAVVQQHGMGPFVNALRSGGTVEGRVLSLMLLTFSSEPLFPILEALALLGAVASWRRSESFLVWWLGADVLFDARGGGNYAGLPLALLIAVGLTQVILPILAPSGGPDPLSLGSSRSRETVATFGIGSGKGRWILGFVLFYAVLSALATAPRTLGTLSKDDRQAMQWVVRKTPPSSRFLVIAGHGAGARDPRLGGDAGGGGWANDRTSEWFPALSGRASVMTVQGHEWLGGWARLQEEYYGLQKCAIEGSACISAWQNKTNAQFGYIYVVKDAAEGQRPTEGQAYDPADFRGCCEPLRASLLGSRDYSLIYDGPGATIFARRSATGLGGDR